MENEQLSTYNKESVPLIRQELEYAYADGKHKSLEEFFTHHNVDGFNAFKRANIATSSPRDFEDISKVCFASYLIFCFHEKVVVINAQINGLFTVSGLGDTELAIFCPLLAFLVQNET